MACSKPLDLEDIFNNKTISENMPIKIFKLKRDRIHSERYGYFSSLDKRIERAYNRHCNVSIYHYYLNYKTIDGKMVTTLLDVNDGYGITSFCTI